MGPKLLFLFGIVVAHGALAAGWIANEMPGTRVAAAGTCVNAPTPMPDFSARFEILAMNLPPRTDGFDEVRRP